MHSNFAVTFSTNLLTTDIILTDQELVQLCHPVLNRIKFGNSLLFLSSIHGLICSMRALNLNLRWKKME